jgi:hypothetical protein
MDNFAASPVLESTCQNPISGRESERGLVAVDLQEGLG